MSLQMPQQATQFGRSIAAPNDPWLAKQPAEPILDPELPIIDTTMLLLRCFSNADRCTAPTGRLRCVPSVRPSLSPALPQ
jgi:hypothetical protein